MVSNLPPFRVECFVRFWFLVIARQGCNTLLYFSSIHPLVFAPGIIFLQRDSLRSPSKPCFVLDVPLLTESPHSLSHADNTTTTKRPSINYHAQPRLHLGHAPRCPTNTRQCHTVRLERGSTNMSRHMVADSRPPTHPNLSTPQHGHLYPTQGNSTAAVTLRREAEGI